MIQRPARVYLDTANWIDLAEEKVDRHAFENLIRSRSVLPVLSFIHVIELAAQEVDSRTRVAEFLDDVRGAVEIQWIKGLRALVHLEVRAAFLAWMGTPPRPLDPFASTLVDALEMDPGWMDRTIARTNSIKRSVDEVAEVMATRPDYQQARATVPARKAAVRASRGKYRRFLVTERQSFINALLPSQLGTDTGLTISITANDRERFLSSVDLASCPALALLVALGEGWILGSGDAPSDFEDWGHLGGIAYSDVSFVDARTWEALRLGKVRPLPHRNGEFEAWARSKFHLDRGNTVMSRSQGV